MNQHYSLYKIFWICQISGWFLLIFINFFILQVNENLPDFIVPTLLYTFVLGISLTTLFRYYIIRRDWLKYNIRKLLPPLAFTIFLVSFIHFISYNSFLNLLTGKFLFDYTFISNFNEFANISAIYIIWSLIYFLVNYIANYKKEEIKNLQSQISNNEIELNNLKSQLNPHFMFNSMNSIRALIDENPQKAKTAVTQLSNVLRSSLMLNKKPLIKLEDELHLVDDYLNLEKIRYEERLQVEKSIEDLTLTCLVPPLIIQTLCENAIKHGISHLPNGGKIIIRSYFLERDKIEIDVINSGQLHDNDPNENSTQVGVKNTFQRLNLIYKGKATFNIRNLNTEYVISSLIIPKNINYENHYY